MKAKLEFNLPEDQQDFEQAVRAYKVELAIWEYSQKLRSMYKYGDKETIRTDEARQLLFDIFRDNDINADLL